MNVNNIILVGLYTKDLLELVPMQFWFGTIGRNVVRVSATRYILVVNSL